MKIFASVFLIALLQTGHCYAEGVGCTINAPTTVKIQVSAGSPGSYTCSVSCDTSTPNDPNNFHVSCTGMALGPGETKTCYGFGNNIAANQYPTVRAICSQN